MEKTAENIAVRVSRRANRPAVHYAGNWAVVTGASSGFGRDIALRLAERGMKLVLTGRSEARLGETAVTIGEAFPGTAVDLVAADLASREGLDTLLAHVGDRPVEVLVNNAGFGTYGAFIEIDAAREEQEIAVDVAAVVALAKAWFPGMVARGHGGILNIASTISFQPGPYQAVYGASKAFVLSFSQALWGEAIGTGVAVTALCPGPTRTGFVEALGADVSHTAIFSRLAEPGPVIDAGMRGFDKGRAVVIPGLRNWIMAQSSRFLPRELMNRVTVRLLGPKRETRPALVVDNRLEIAAPASAVWSLLTDVSRWPEWYRACRWVRSDGEAGEGTAFRWKAHPVELTSKVIASDGRRRFAFTADGRGVHAEREFTVEASADGRSSLVTSHETQVGWLPRLGGLIVGPKLKAANDAMFADLARAAVRLG